MPMNLSGRLEVVASDEIGIVDVLEAKVEPSRNDGLRPSRSRPS